MTDLSTLDEQFVPAAPHLSFLDIARENLETTIHTDGNDRRARAQQIAVAAAAVAQAEAMWALVHAMRDNTAHLRSNTQAQLALLGVEQGKGRRKDEEKIG
jgi:hypothetical protein